MRVRALPCAPGSTAGFSLVETLVCLTLLAGAAVSVAGVTLTAARSVEVSGRRAEALAWASTALDILQAAPAGHPWVRPGGDLERSVAADGGVWFAAAGAYLVRWRVRPLRPPGDLAAIEVVVHDRNAVDGRRPLARLHGTRGGFAL